MFLAVTAQAAVARLVLVLEDVDLAAASLVNDLGHHACALDGGGADGDAVLAADEQDVADLHGVPGVARQALNAEALPRRHAILLSAGADNGVHGPS